MSKRRLPRRPPAHQAAGKPHRFTVALLALGIDGEGLCRMMCAVESICEGRRALLDERIEFFPPSLLYEIEIVAHAAALPPDLRPPNSRRYASMNGSMSPSITRCTSGIFSSVRWSFTIVYGWNT